MHAHPFNPSLVRLDLPCHPQERKHRSTFNPSLVRLDRPASAASRPGPAAFNPSLVRLDLEGYVRTADAAYHAFQSQFGAIGSRQVVLPRVVGLEAFNPSLVRLDHSNPGPSPTQPAILSIPVWCDWILPKEWKGTRTQLPFNPSLVRLDHEHQFVAAVAADQAFNPSLVRLDPDIEHEYEHPAHPFQSQFGAIGSRTCSRWDRTSTSFQSQFGAIGSVWVKQPAVPQGSFQSQFGAIGSI